MKDMQRGLREWEGVYVGERVSWFCSHHCVGSVLTQTRGGLQVLTPGRNAGERSWSLVVVVLTLTCHIGHVECVTVKYSGHN